MKEYLIKYQNVLYKTLLNSKKRNKFPQAILLNSTKDVPVLEIAKYIASWVVSKDEEPNEEDPSCNKVKNGTYADLILIDGKVIISFKGYVYARKY